MSADSERQRFVAWQSVAICIAVAATFVAAHSHFYFNQSHWEFGDYAANALRIFDAKRGAELYGNYSRWKFNHPGPAFFYLYAAGEWIFYDWLRVVRSPFASHLLTGVLVQCAILTWALRILARRLAPADAVPVLLVAAAVYFGLVNHNVPDSAIQSIWPPYVLLMPFLCFLVACASFASRCAKDVVPAVTMGGLLVHGHVAQPLFVVPFFLLSCVAAFGREYLHSASPGGWIGRHRGHFAAAAGILSLFVLPIAIDAVRGDESNLRLILNHFSSYSGDRKTLGQSLVYLTTFFCMMPNAEAFADDLRSGGFVFVAQRWPYVLGWLAIAGAVAGMWKMSLRRDAFVRWLLVYYCLGIALTLVWGIAQTGPMFTFNGYFNFALLFVPVVIVPAALWKFVPERAAKAAAPLLFIVAVPLMFGAARNWRADQHFFRPSWGAAQPDRLLAAAGEQPHKPKFLIFPHAAWPAATGVAIALRRAGFTYQVPPEWNFMFDREHKTDLLDALTKQHAVPWKIAVGESAVSDIQIEGNTVIAEPPPVDPAGTRIQFNGTEMDAEPFVLTGWDLSQGPFSWSDSDAAVLYWKAVPATTDVEILLDVFPAILVPNERQRMIVTFAGESQTYELTADELVSLRVPATTWNAVTTPALLFFSFPDAKSPAELHISEDTRKLGYGFRSIQFRELSE